MSDAAATVEEIIAACRSMVGLPYDGEPVDQLQHALQCAALARQRARRRRRLRRRLPAARHRARAGRRRDRLRRPAASTTARRARAGSTPRVGERVAWLAEQHVPAKRYLVATDPAYRAQLSEVSLRTLERAGRRDERRPRSPSSARNPDWEQAVALRRIDDRGKVVGPRGARHSSPTAPRCWRSSGGADA